MKLHEYLSQVRERANRVHSEVITGYPPPFYEKAAASQLDVPKLALIAEKLHKALEYVERRTDPEQKNPVGDHYIRSTRMRGVVTEALEAVEQLITKEKQ